MIARKSVAPMSALRRLAGLDRMASVFEAIALFDRAALELNLQLPNSEEALLREYLRVVAADIVEKEIRAHHRKWETPTLGSP